MKNKYKEQMDKISVDDDMKKRVMNRIRESQYLKTKGNKSCVFWSCQTSNDKLA